MIIEGPAIDLPVPCPFCGSTRGVVVQMERFGVPPADADPEAGWWHFYVRCLSCSAEGPPAKTGSVAAVNMWSHRPRRGAR